MAENAILGIDLARHQRPDLILLDVMLPILSGYDACSLMRQDERTKRIPIIFLTAKATSQDVAHGFSFGADDYISKPFDLKELQARIQARLRMDPAKDSPPIQVGDLWIDPSQRLVKYAGKSYKLTLTEFDILRLLASRAGETLSREVILEEVWKDDRPDTNDRTIDVHIRALRKKIPEMSRQITSIYGVGYRYAA